MEPLKKGEKGPLVDGPPKEPKEEKFKRESHRQTTPAQAAGQSPLLEKDVIYDKDFDYQHAYRYDIPLRDRGYIPEAMFIPPLVRLSAQGTLQFAYRNNIGNYVVQPVEPLVATHLKTFLNTVPKNLGDNVLSTKFQSFVSLLPHEMQEFTNVLMRDENGQYIRTFYKVFLGSDRFTILLPAAEEILQSLPGDKVPTDRKDSVFELPLRRGVRFFPQNSSREQTLSTILCLPPFMYINSDGDVYWFYRWGPSRRVVVDGIPADVSNAVANALPPGTRGEIYTPYLFALQKLATCVFGDVLLEDSKSILGLHVNLDVNDRTYEFLIVDPDPTLVGGRLDLPGVGVQVIEDEEKKGEDPYKDMPALEKVVLPLSASKPVKAAKAVGVPVIDLTVDDNDDIHQRLVKHEPAEPGPRFHPVANIEYDMEEVVEVVGPQPTVVPQPAVVPSDPPPPPSPPHVKPEPMPVQPPPIVEQLQPQIQTNAPIQPVAQIQQIQQTASQGGNDPGNRPSAILDVADRKDKDDSKAMEITSLQDAKAARKVAKRTDRAVKFATDQQRQENEQRMATFQQIAAAANAQYLEEQRQRHEQIAAAALEQQKQEYEQSLRQQAAGFGEQIRTLTQQLAASKEGGEAQQAKQAAVEQKLGEVQQRLRGVEQEYKNFVEEQERNKRKGNPVPKSPDGGGGGGENPRDGVPPSKPIGGGDGGGGTPIPGGGGGSGGPGGSPPDWGVPRNYNTPKVNENYTARTFNSPVVRRFGSNDTIAIRTAKATYVAKILRETKIQTSTHGVGNELYLLQFNANQSPVTQIGQQQIVYWLNGPLSSKARQWQLIPAFASQPTRLLMQQSNRVPVQQLYMMRGK